MFWQVCVMFYRCVTCFTGVWHIFTSVWHVLTSIWHVLTSVWHISTIVWHVLTRGWNMLTWCDNMTWQQVWHSNMFKALSLVALDFLEICSLYIIILRFLSSFNRPTSNQCRTLFIYKVFEVSFILNGLAQHHPKIYEIGSRRKPYQILSAGSVSNSVPWKCFKYCP